jgi:DmsE family decaheme c-type cytochrome
LATLRSVGILKPILFLAVPALAALSLAGGPGASPAAAEPAQGGNEVGNAVCVGCHQPYANLVNRTPHGAAGIGAGCEGCHGGGGPHARAMVTATTPEAREAGRALIFGFDESPTQNAGRCLGCHEANIETQAFDHSEHQLNGVACQNCHSPHLTGADRSEEDRWLGERLLRTSQPELCFGCHTTVAGQFSLPTHHPVEEGLVACTNCHNPHGSRNQPMLRSANWETCVGCHIDKRGPFVFEHGAARVEGCTTCHTPHGSVNRMLLVRREERFLCLQCHVDPFAANVPHGRLGFQTSGDCARCHTAVHGSNSSPFLLD